ncbi:SRPBCC family protein [Haloarchaeobius litoreus]|uniref:SRPBCC family protein n=1 Tax=Haloarchaeobius litoreus TaxID=755306 RepID=A0ABD6DHN7_9EURY|nr:SRPBCC family protein [Haloarchaeobius litoreus]
MNTVTLSRSIDAPAETVREAMADLQAFTEAAGFDDVAVDGDEVVITNHVGLLELQLELVVTVDEPDRLVLDQRDGIFESMETRYTVTGDTESCEVTAETDFALDVAIVGAVLDATVIERQRSAELTRQLDWLQERFEDGS